MEFTIERSQLHGMPFWIQRGSWRFVRRCSNWDRAQTSRGRKYFFVTGTASDLDVPFSKRGFDFPPFEHVRSPMWPFTFVYVRLIMSFSATPPTWRLALLVTPKLLVVLLSWQLPLHRTPYCVKGKTCPSAFQRKGKGHLVNTATVGSVISWGVEESRVTFTLRCSVFLRRIKNKRLPSINMLRTN